MKQTIFFVATAVLLTAGIVHPLFAWDFGAHPTALPGGLTTASDQEFLYAVRAIVPDRYYCVGHKAVGEGGYWGGEGQCGVNAAKDALALLRSAVSYFYCTAADGREIDYSFEHRSFYKKDDPSSAKISPIVLARTNAIRCETDPSSLSGGVVESKSSEWKKECAEKGCQAVYQGRGRYFLLLKRLIVPAMPTDADVAD